MPEEPPEIPSGLVLTSSEEGLELRHPDASPGQGVRANLAPIRPGRHPLGKALPDGEGPVIDATAGLGGDTAVVAALGHRVLAIERNDVLFALLQDARARLADHEQAERITLQHADAIDVLASPPPAFAFPAAIVIDPMYPLRRKASALPGKPMQLLRALLDDRDEQEDLEALLRAAFATSARRIILKRPPEASTPEAFHAPTFSIESKLVRWDVWECGEG